MLYSILVCSILLGCSEKPVEVEVPEVESRVVSLNFNLSTRIADGGVSSEDMPGSVKLWAFENTAEGNLVFYHEYTRVEWTKIVQNEQEKVEFTALLPKTFKTKQETVNIRVYAVINSESVLSYNDELESQDWQPLALGETTSEAVLKECRFRINSDTQKCTENQLLMFGSTTVIDKLEEDKLYKINIDAKRCVSKLELYVTQFNNDVQLKIKKVTLAKRPDVGYLLPITGELPTSNKEPLVIFENLSDGQAITSVLGRKVQNTSDDSFAEAYDNDNTTFTPLVPILLPILTERRGVSENIEATGTEDAYILTITYSDFHHSELTKVIALKNIERNTRYRVFIRASLDTPIEIFTGIKDWIYGKGEYRIDITDRY